MHITSKVITSAVSESYAVSNDASVQVIWPSNASETGSEAVHFTAERNSLRVRNLTSSSTTRLAYTWLVVTFMPLQNEPTSMFQTSFFGITSC